MVLWNERDIGLPFSGDRIAQVLQIDVTPSRELDFLLAATRAKKKQITQVCLGRHRRKQFGEFVCVIGFRPSAMHFGQFDQPGGSFDAICLKQREHKSHACADRLVAVTLASEKFDIGAQSSRVRQLIDEPNSFW